MTHASAPINGTIEMPEFDDFKLEARSEEFIVVLSLGGVLLGTVKRLETYRGKVSRQWIVHGFGRDQFIFTFAQIALKVRESLAGGM